jgi:hypothetical protein
MSLKLKKKVPNPRNVSESLMEFTPQSLDTKRAKETMRTLPYEEAKAGVSRVIERPLEELGALSEWDLSFSEYIEEHKNSTLLFCWYAKYVAVVFSPADKGRRCLITPTELQTPIVGVYFDCQNGHFQARISGLSMP